ncbi:MAG: DUF2339 domain-containing protein [Candidatus Saccharibacteria bacterium]
MSPISDDMLNDRVDQLTSELEGLKKRVAEIEGILGQRMAPVRPVEPVRQEKMIVVDFPNNNMPTVRPPSQAAPSPAASQNWESFFGGKFLNRVGIMIILLGVAFFLKLSIDNNWIGPTGRVILGYIGGIAMFFAGDRLMKKGYEYFSQGFTGGGLAVIYLATYFALHEYDMLSRGTAFALMAATAAAAGLLAVRQNAYGVALVATLGGFLTPVLVGSLHPNPVGLLSFVAILNLAVLFMAFYKNWRSLNFIALIATGILVTAYTLVEYPVDSGVGSVALYQSFYTLFLVIFGALPFVINIRQKVKSDGADICLIILNAAIYFGMSIGNLPYDPPVTNWYGLLAILLAAGYLISGVLVKRANEEDQLLFLTLLGTGLAFATVAIPLQLNGRWISIAWIVESVALVYGGLRAKNVWVRVAGLSLLLISALWATFDVELYYRTTPIFNFYTASALLAILGSFVVSKWYYANTDISEGERVLGLLAAVFGVILSLVLITADTVDVMEYYEWYKAQDFAVSIAWALLAVGVLFTGILKTIKGLRITGLALLSITVIKVVFYDLHSLDMAWKVLISLILGGILVGVSFIYQNREKGEAA